VAEVSVASAGDWNGGQASCGPEVYVGCACDEEVGAGVMAWEAGAGVTAGELRAGPIRTGAWVSSEGPRALACGVGREAGSYCSDSSTRRGRRGGGMAAPSAHVLFLISSRDVGVTTVV
jgi:hypothetical protein